MSYFFKHGSYNLEVCGKSVEWTHTNKVSSIFKLNNNDVELLKTHNIVKIRCKYNKFIDIENNKSFKDCKSISDIFIFLQNRYNTYKSELNVEIKKSKEQQKMKENPLYNF